MNTSLGTTIASWSLGWARGVALFIGGFTLLNGMAGGGASPDFDGNLWWIDLRFLPSPVASALLAAAGALLVGLAIRPRCGRLRRCATLAALGCLAAVTLANASEFWRLMAIGRIAGTEPFPVSLFVCGAFVWIAVAVWREEGARHSCRLNLRPAGAFGRGPAPAAMRTSRRPEGRGPRKARHLQKVRETVLDWLAAFQGRNRRGAGFPRAGHFIAVVAAFVFCCLAFPVLQVFCFGHTDYRRRADAAIVFGARAYADGRPSMALSDRVRTACELYHAGLVPRVVFSGGPGDGPVHETEAMARLARTLGVPDEAIELDRFGVSTAATVRNTILTRPAGARIIAVSEFYHLPRIKLACHDAGREVYTVPARPSHWLRNWPLRSIAREVAGFWFYYLRGLATRHD